jgi:hypothetical protein
LPDIYYANHQAGQYPDYRHQRDKPLHEPGDAMKTANDCQQSKDSKNNACHQRGKIKRKTQSSGNSVCLNSAENYAVGDEQKDGEQNAHPAHPQPARHIPCRSATKLPIDVTFFIKLCKGTFGKRGRHADKRCNPHPKDGSRSTGGNSQRNAGQVAATHARRKTGTQ